MEKVRTKEDVDKIFESKRKFVQLQTEFFKLAKASDRTSMTVYRQMQVIRTDIHRKYGVLL